ncbi:MAG: glycosyltransferase [Candidatus Binatia bacterium]
MHSESLVVFSHLDWNSVFQRPHHLMTRLAAHYQVWFVEEPRHGAQPRIDCRTAAPGLTVCTPYTAQEERGFGSRQNAAAAPGVRAVISRRAQPGPLAWLYTPMALSLARDLRPATLIYDCMDELTGFLFASEELPARETDLLAAADLVFTGGPSLYRAKRHRHPRVHCFPSSVDAAHFRRALSSAEALDVAALRRPRVGYYGVIDERIDYALLDEVAHLRPSWELIMVGPIVKIDPSCLPRRRNIHFLGPRSYDALPRYLASWDVCMLPFARNDATRFISPTKTLEYMAAERPVVSTPIRDVQDLYGHVVNIAETGAQFTAACERLLSESPAERERRCAAMRDVVAGTSWDGTVTAMRELIIARRRVSTPLRRAAAVGESRSFT